MKTYEDLQALILTGDPLIDPEAPEKPVLREDGLFLPGYDVEGVGHAHDLLIAIKDDQYVLSYREPGAAEWFQTTEHHTYEDLVHWVYSL